MAIFSSKKNTEAKKETKAVVAKSSAPASTKMHSSLLSVLVRPRVTEKASLKAQNNVYAFEVSKEATKDTVARAIQDKYKVTPVKVHMVAIPSKMVFVRGKKGVKGGGKKAYVYVKKGEAIEFT